MKELVMVKIGGGVITDKNKRYGLKKKVLQNISVELGKAYGEMEDAHLIIGNGAGSFAHWSARKYKTAEGFVNSESKVGAGWVRHDAVKLNQIVVEELLKNNMPAFSFSPSSMMRVESGMVMELFTASLEDALEKGVVPVVYGDPVIDGSSGSGIFSTEKVFSVLVDRLREKYMRVRIIHVSSEDGVRVEGKVVSEISDRNFDEVKSAINGSGGVDVTGGMIHKVMESLELAASGIESVIVSGLRRGRMKEALLGRAVIGTVIR